MSSSLAGKRILVTRPRDEAAELSSLLRERGAEPLESPAIAIEPVEGEALERLDIAVRDLADGAFAWVVFTSVRSVDAILGRLAAQGYGPYPQVVQARLAAVGEATAARLGDAGLRAELVPDRFTTEALAEAFPTGQGRVLTPRADIAPAGLEEALEAKGWSPTRVDAYRTRSLPLTAEATRMLAGEVDAVVFTSSSTVRGFAEAGGRPGRAAVVCIGPVTARQASDAGFEVAAVAEPHTVEGLVLALERHFEKMGP